MSDPGPTPHVGGPIVTGENTVLIEGRLASRIGDESLCTGVGAKAKIGSGSPTVIIGGQKAARLGDTLCHGGQIVSGAATVIIGDSGYSAMSAAHDGAAPFVSMESQ
nr:PAAR domain-containing protein [Cystobacter ferrugineus]